MEKELEEIGVEITADRARLAGAWDRAEAASIKAAETISQHRIAELLGVDRMTVRKWVGKR
jgi:DNA-binding transcriptional regulator YiaG